GTPMVVADSPGFRALVNGGREAVTLPHDDPARWGQTIVGLLGDPGRRRAMGAAGVAKAARYAWPVVAEQVLAVYRGVLHRSTHRRRRSARTLALVRPG
ncbi:MAG TPA: glycosyltransferase, partial [Gemmatimonadales bacterium]